MLNELKQAVSRLPVAVRAGTLSIAIAGLWATGCVLFPSQTTSRAVWADETPAAPGGPTKPKVLSAEEQKALAEFYKRYRLDKDQIVKYIKPPFVAGRLIDRNHRWKDRFGNGDHGTGGMYVYCYIFFERDGKLEPPHNFAAGSHHREAASNGIELTTLMSMFAKVWDRDIVDPDKLLNRRIVGDYIIRADAPLDKVVVALGEVLNRECNVPIKLELLEFDEDVVIVRGGVKPQFVSKLDSPIKLYVDNFRPEQGAKEQGKYAEFLEAIGEFIEPNRRVISEVEKPPQANMAWHRNVPDLFDDGDVESVLGHLEEQTGLKFALESRKSRRILVERTAAPPAVVIANPPADKEKDSVVMLADAVKEFNQRAQEDTTGAGQPPLTVDEVVAAIRGWIRERAQATDDVYNAYQAIADTKQLPAGATLTFTTQWLGFNRYDFDVWWVDLNIKTDPRAGYTFRVRDQMLRCRPSGQAPDAKPQAAAADRSGSKETTSDVEKLLAEFRKIYHLEEGQVIKRIKPPLPAGRMHDLDKWIPEFKVFSGGTYKEANLQCLVYRERNGKLEAECPFFSYNTAGGAAKGYEAGSLAAVVSNIEYRGIEDPDHLLLGKPIFGDYVVNADVPADKIVAALGQMLNRECGLPVKLELREGEDRIVVVRGRFKASFIPRLDSPVELYAATLQPNQGEKDQGTFQEFLDDVGRFIEPNYCLVNAVEDARQEKIYWHRNVRTRFDDKSLHDDREPRSVLEHLEAQTGLKFAMEPHKFRKIIVTRSE